MGNKLMGRPQKVIDQKTFEKLCGIQCTLQEVCAFFDVHENTLNSWCKRTYGTTFSEVFSAKRELGKISLRRSMWQSAEKGNTTMQIYLSKQHLGMSDHVKVEAKADGKLADLIEGLMEPLNGEDGIHEETAGTDAAVASAQAETNQPS